jgi:hypothetical protein
LELHWGIFLVLSGTNMFSRRLAAVTCLLAIALLQAPFARAAWMSSSLGCCMSDQCPVPGHHHKGQAQHSDMPMDCGHDMSKVSDCKMSCCKTTDETAINIVQFVMPSVQVTLDSLRAISHISHFAPQMISRSEKPQSPPPKSLLA